MKSDDETSGLDGHIMVRIIKDLCFISKYVVDYEFYIEVRNSTLKQTRDTQCKRQAAPKKV